MGDGLLKKMLSLDAEAPDDITIVLDRSGSMHSCWQPTIEGVNAFIAAQRAVERPATLTVNQFDHEFTPMQSVPIQYASPLTKQNYVPRGNTALYDAVGRTINAIDARRPKGKVIVVVATDGQENASREFSPEQIKELIEKRTDAGWQFVFIGAEQNAWDAGGKMGALAVNTMSTLNSAGSTQAAWSAVTSNAGLYRGGGKGSMAFTPTQYQDQGTFGSVAADADTLAQASALDELDKKLAKSQQSDSDKA